MCGCSAGPARRHRRSPGSARHGARTCRVAPEHAGDGLCRSRGVVVGHGGYLLLSTLHILSLPTAGGGSSGNASRAPPRLSTRWPPSWMGTKGASTSAVALRSLGDITTFGLSARRRVPLEPVVYPSPNGGRSAVSGRAGDEQIETRDREHNSNCTRSQRRPAWNQEYYPG